MANAQKDLDEAKTAISSLEDTFNNMIENDNPKDVLPKLKTDVKNITDQFKSIHNTLVKLIGDLRGLRVGQLKISVTPKPTN